MLKKILAAIEDPTFCDEKVQTAASLAQKNSGELAVLHVLHSTSTIYRNFVRHYRTGEEIVTNCDYEEEVRSEIEKHCVPFHCNYEIKVVDIIAMGSHTKKKEDGKWYPGSAVEGVASRAPCPVVVVTDPQALLKT